jgi:putative membrane protein
VAHDSVDANAHDASLQLVVVSDRQEASDMMYWYDHDMGGWAYAGMAVGMVLFWALIIVGIIALVRFAISDQTRRQAQPTAQPSAQQLLGVRFARGEIDDNEYREKIAVLRDHSAM